MPSDSFVLVADFEVEMVAVGGLLKDTSELDDAGDDERIFESAGGLDFVKRLEG
jgi:hypothetical protein